MIGLSDLSLPSRSYTANIVGNAVEPVVINLILPGTVEVIREQDTHGRDVAINYFSNTRNRVRNIVIVGRHTVENHRHGVGGIDCLIVERGYFIEKTVGAISTIFLCSLLQNQTKWQVPCIGLVERARIDLFNEITNLMKDVQVILPIAWFREVLP
ncbi:hypothetical protein D3C76_1217730 [compost metagenome]